jgi:hypothetical protein
MLHHKERNLWGCEKSQCLEYAWVSIEHARREATAALEGGASPDAFEVLSAQRSPLVATRQRDGGDTAASRAAAPAVGGGGLDALLRLLDGAHGDLYLIVQVMHGLGNRLRALSSALSYARTVGRRVAIVWETDIHCHAQLSDLFEPIDGVPVFASIGATSGVALERLESRPDVAVLRQLPPDRTGRGSLSMAQRQRNTRKHLFVQSSFRIASAYAIGLPHVKVVKPWHEMRRTFAEFQQAVRRLRPVASVTNLARDFEARLGGSSALDASSSGAQIGR